MLGWAQFPGEDVDLLKDATVTPIAMEEMFQPYSYRNFYAEINPTTKAINILKNYKGDGQTGSSNYNYLFGKEFKVSTIYPIDEHEYTLVLVNDELGTIYYQYDTRFGSSWELKITSEVVLPDDFYCKRIEVSAEYDRTIYRAPAEGGIFLTKVTGKYTTYVLMINQLSTTLTTGKKGLELALADGKKISKPEADIDIDVNNYGDYIYTGSTIITEAEMKLISEHAPIGAKVYIHSGTIKNGDLIKEYAKCLLKL